MFLIGEEEICCQSPPGLDEEMLLLLIFLRTNRYIRQISDSIASRIPGASRAEIEARVNQSYENLLMRAKVLVHIPNLVEGQVRAEFRHRVHKR